MRRKKKKSDDNTGGVPAWMLTYSDVVTLLMTFFVMLVSMASMTDASKRKVALGSVSGRFGTGAPRLDDLTVNASQVVEPGPMNDVAAVDKIRERAQENPDEDLAFEYNKFIQRVTLDAATLFEPGSTELTAQGKELLDTVRPVIADSAHPLGLAGHSADGREELGPEYAGARDKMDFSWQLSLTRVMVVYRYFVDSGISPEKLRLEAFGRYHPKFAPEDINNRKFNRRVEITLDKRLESWKPHVAAEISAIRKKSQPPARDAYNVGNFLFHFDRPEGEK